MVAPEHPGTWSSDPDESPTRGGSGAMFDRIAPRYDLLNRVLSLGIDRGWRRQAVTALQLAPGARVLDIATGTADLALEVAERHASVSVVGVDPSRGMLDVGRQKVEAAGVGDRVSLQEGRAESLPFAEASFDAVMIAFGIRNVPDRGAALAEMARVTRPGGRVVVLELGEPRRGIMGSLARFHIHVLVPQIGAWLSSSPEYRYLERSIAAFPQAEEFGQLMEQSGLNLLSIQPLTFGVSNLYVGEGPRMTREAA